MILELRGQFFGGNKHHTHALVRVESIEIIIARTNTEDNRLRQPYLFIQCSSHSIDWVCADDDELYRRFAYLKSKMFECDMVEIAPIKCEPIEEIKNNLEDL